MTEAELDAEARALLAALALQPRPAGSAAEAAARSRCAAWLQSLGYLVEEQPFAFSALPGRWGTPAAGGWSALAIAVTTWLGLQGATVAALVAALFALAVLALAGRWMARRGVLTAPWLRSRSVNLLATHAVGKPAVWLVAHLDSKSQPVSIGVRASGVVATAVVWVIVIAMCGMQLAGVPVGGGLWMLAGLAGVAAAMPRVRHHGGEPVGRRGGQRLGRGGGARRGGAASRRPAVGIALRAPRSWAWPGRGRGRRARRRQSPSTVTVWTMEDG